MARILVVDDEPFILTSIARALRDSGEVKTVESASKALEEIKKCHYALCFLDILLPDMNGLEVMSRINEISPDTKVALMTASQLDENAKKTVLEKAYHFLAKPFTLAQIKEIAKRALEETSELAAPSWKSNTVDPDGSSE